MAVSVNEPFAATPGPAPPQNGTLLAGVIRTASRDRPSILSQNPRIDAVLGSNPRWRWDRIIRQTAWHALEHSPRFPLICEAARQSSSPTLTEEWGAKRI